MRLKKLITGLQQQKTRKIMISNFNKLQDKNID